MTGQYIGLSDGGSFSASDHAVPLAWGSGADPGNLEGCMTRGLGTEVLSGIQGIGRGSEGRSPSEAKGFFKIRYS